MQDDDDLLCYAPQQNHLIRPVGTVGTGGQGVISLLPVFAGQLTLFQPSPGADYAQPITICSLGF
jgi:hypothetical protein